MAILKESNMIYIGETIEKNNERYLLYGNLIKGNTYWIQIVSNEGMRHCIYNIYRQDYNNITDDFPEYIGINASGVDVSKDFISLAEFREQQIKSIIDGN